MGDVHTLWLIPAWPFLGSLVCGLLHFRVLALRRRGAEAGSWARFAGVVAVAAVAGSLALAVVHTLQLAALAPDSNHTLESGAWDWITWNPGAATIAVSMVFDRLSSVMVLVITGVGLLIHVYSTGYMKGDEGYAKFFAYLNLFVGMMLVLVLSSNLVGLFVGWEGVGLCSYLLIGFWYGKGWPAVAAQKAFVVNRIGDAFFLLGMFLLLTTLGSLDLSHIWSIVPHVAEDPVIAGRLAIAALLLFGGACGKSAQMPLFTWLPDAMAGPTPVSALIHAATMVTSGIYLVLRLNPLFAVSEGVMYFIALTGAVTALIGGSSALLQRDIKKILAYSTVSQLGFMFLALGAGAWVAALFHLVTHAFFKALLFLGAGSVIHGMHGEQDVHRMGGLRRHMPRTFVTFAAGAAALSGLPLLSGFFSKDEILASVFAQGGLHYFILWAVGIATAAMTAFYAARMVALTFFGAERFDAAQVHPHESPASMVAPLMVLAVLAVAGGLLGLPAVLPVTHALHSWLEPVTAPGDAILAAHHAGHLPHLSPAVEWMLLGLGAAIALVFAHLGFHAYRAGVEADERFETAQPATAGFLRRAWGIDDAYRTWIVEPVRLVAFFIAVLVDQFVIDGVVNGSARVTRRVAGRLRRMADGSIAGYGMWMGAGAVTIVFLWMWAGI